MALMGCMGHKEINLSDQRNTVLAQLTFAYLYGPNEHLSFFEHQSYFVTIGVTRLSPMLEASAQGYFIELSAVDKQGYVGVRITEPWVAETISNEHPDLIQSSAAINIINAPGTSFGHVFESFVVYGLSKCLNDEAHPFHQQYFGHEFQALTNLTNVRLKEGLRATSRLVCIPSDINTRLGQDCVTGFLDSPPAPFLLLHTDNLAGPDIVCMLTATDLQGNPVEIPMFIQCKLLSTPPRLEVYQP